MLFIYSRPSNAQGRHNAFILLSSLNMQEFMNKLFISLLCDQLWIFFKFTLLLLVKHLPLWLQLIFFSFHMIKVSNAEGPSPALLEYVRVFQLCHGKGWSNIICEINVMLQIGTKKWKLSYKAQYHGLDYIKLGHFSIYGFLALRYNIKILCVYGECLHCVSFQTIFFPFILSSTM